jgi:cellulose biosynthesis protein BcsQ
MESTTDHTCRITTFVSGSGCKSKAVIVFALGHYLARRGRRVLLIDMDLADSHLSRLALPVHPGHAFHTTSDLFQGPPARWLTRCTDLPIHALPAAQSVWQGTVPHGSLWIVPSRAEESTVSMGGYHALPPKRALAISEGIKKLVQRLTDDGVSGDKIDTILIDATKDQDAMAVGCALASDGYVVVADYERSSISQSKRLVDDLRRRPRPEARSLITVVAVNAHEGSVDHHSLKSLFLADSSLALDHDDDGRKWRFAGDDLPLRPFSHELAGCVKALATVLAKRQDWSESIVRELRQCEQRHRISALVAHSNRLHARNAPVFRRGLVLVQAVLLSLFLAIGFDTFAIRDEQSPQVQDELHRKSDDSREQSAQYANRPPARGVAIFSVMTMSFLVIGAQWVFASNPNPRRARYASRKFGVIKNTRLSFRLFGRQEREDASVDSSEIEVPMEPVGSGSRPAIFISYNTRDRREVERLIRKLCGKLPQALVDHIFLSECETKPGHSIPKDVNEHLRRAVVFVLLVGPHKLGPFQEHEIWGVFRKLLNEEIRLVPVILPACGGDVAVPLLLSHYRQIDCRIDMSKAIGELVNTITAELTSESNIAEDSETAKFLRASVSNP